MPRIRQAIARDLSRRHVPHHVIEVSGIPYNANGKKMEIQLKAILNRGAEAMASMKISDKERSSLECFVNFFDLGDSYGQEGATREPRTGSKL